MFRGPVSKLSKIYLRIIVLLKCNDNLRQIYPPRQAAKRRLENCNVHQHFQADAVRADQNIAASVEGRF
jgi:hypothetical protein